MEVLSISYCQLRQQLRMHYGLTDPNLTECLAYITVIKACHRLADAGLACPGLSPPGGGVRPICLAAPAPAPPALGPGESYGAPYPLRCGVATGPPL